MTQVVNTPNGINKGSQPVLEPLNGQDLAENFDSFQYFADEDNTFDKLDPEDFKRLEHFQRVLANEEINRYNYRKEFEKATEQLNNIMASNFSIHIKTQMSQSIRDSLQTQLNCLREANKNTREMIIEVEKMNNYSTYLNLIQKWKDSHRFAKNHSTASTDVNSYTSPSPQKRNSIISKRTYSIISNQTLAEDAPEECRRVDEMFQENIKIEDMIANLKETRNYLIIGIENARDDMSEYQEFVQSKNNALKEKLRFIEQLKSKISIQSSKKSSSSKFSSKYKSGSETERNERSMSRVNTTVFQDVSSKVSNLFGKMFGGKSKQSNNDKILTTEFMGELNLQTLPSDYTSPKSSASYKYNGREPPLSAKNTKR